MTQKGCYGKRPAATSGINSFLSILAVCHVTTIEWPRVCALLVLRYVNVS